LRGLKRLEEVEEENRGKGEVERLMVPLLRGARGELNRVKITL